MLDTIDSLIDGITMYRLLLYYLIALLVSAVGLSFFGDLHYKPLHIVLSALILVGACWFINRVFAYIFDAPINGESSLLTGLILALIIAPSPTGLGLLFMLAASGLAIASKYLLTIRKKHIFNPAAIAVVLTALGPKQSATWWVGTAVMLPFVLIGGLLVMRKVRRERMVLTFFASASVATIVYSGLSHSNIISSFHNMILSSSIFFLGFVMLTEPMTSPVTTKKQSWYAVLVGVLFPPQVHVLSLYSSPELALTVGNIFSYIVSPKKKLFPKLIQKIRISDTSVDFIFNPGQTFKYKPGQYMEWTLPHHKIDSRGSRRYLTLSSSPTESDIRIGVKFYDHGSSFKRALLDIDGNTPIVAAQLAGEFVMPKNTSKKLVFIAGGIGITPFRSMVKYLMDTQDKRTVTLVYSARTESDLAYKNLFERARQTIGLRAFYIITDQKTVSSDNNTISGSLSAHVIIKTVPDYLERVFYISGTHSMVVSARTILSELGVSPKNIKEDFFPGYA